MSQPATPPISGLHHSGFSVRGLPASIAWYRTGIHSMKEPFVYSTNVFRDLDNIQLEFAIDV